MHETEGVRPMSRDVVSLSSISVQRSLYVYFHESQIRSNIYEFTFPLFVCTSARHVTAWNLTRAVHDS